MRNFWSAVLTADRFGLPRFHILPRKLQDQAVGRTSLAAILPQAGGLSKLGHLGHARPVVLSSPQDWELLDNRHGAKSRTFSAHPGHAEICMASGPSIVPPRFAARKVRGLILGCSLGRESGQLFT